MYGAPSAHTFTDRVNVWGTLICFSCQRTRPGIAWACPFCFCHRAAPSHVSVVKQKAAREATSSFSSGRILRVTNCGYSVHTTLVKEQYRQLKPTSLTAESGDAGLKARSTRGYRNKAPLTAAPGPA
jgi:hypothetical protein